MCQTDDMGVWCNIQKQDILNQQDSIILQANQTLRKKNFILCHSKLFILN